MKKAKIAIIEDEGILVEALRTALNKVGYEIVYAMDGKLGTELVKREKPDLVLLDVLLPEKDGFVVLADLKKNNTTKDIPVIILTNLSDSEVLKKATKLGAVDSYLKASTELRDLLTKIESFLKNNVS